MIKWFFYFYIYSVVQLSPLSNSRTSSSLQREAISSHSPFLPPLSSKQFFTCFLPLWICLFQTFHVNEVLQRVVFCVWLLSLCIMFSWFIYVVVYTRISFLLWWNNNLLYRYTIFYLFTSWWTFIYPFCILWMMLLWTFVYMFLCGHLFSALLGDIPRSVIARSCGNYV